MSRMFFAVIAVICLTAFPAEALSQEAQGASYPYSLVNYPEGGPNALDAGCMVTLNVVLHIIRDENGQGGITVAEALAAFDYLNDVFSDYYISFQHLDPQQPVRDHDVWDAMYYPMSYNGRLAVVGHYTVANAINIFFVDGNPNESWLGFTGDYIPDKDMFIRSGYQSSSVIIHEMGHLFGLWHTHGYDDNNEEFVTRGPGANCTTAGDKLCDTPAEPNNNNKGIQGYVDYDCEYFGTFKDANNEDYVPDTGNFMSYSPLHCKNSFSPRQVEVMRSYIANDHYTRLNTVATRTVRFANIVSGVEHHDGDIRIDLTDGAELYTATSPFNYDLAPCVIYSVTTLSERLTGTSGDEKHQHWNTDFTTYRLSKQFHVQKSDVFVDQYAYFTEMLPVTINALHDGGAFAPMIRFKDPWYLESDDTQPGLFNAFAAPHQPTGAYNEQSGGVFKHGTDLNFPRYLLQVDRCIDGNLQAVQLPPAIGDWVCVGVHSADTDAAAVSLSQDYPDLLHAQFTPAVTRIVEFKQADADLYAEYKAHRCSADDIAPSAGNSQRRIVYDHRDATLQLDDRYHAVYESEGSIYHIYSDDAGASWSPETRVTDALLNCTRPSLAIIDNDEADGRLYMIHVDVENSEVVLSYFVYHEPLLWTEFDRIAVTSPAHCRPSIAALKLDGHVRAVAAAWEDIGVTLPGRQTPTNVIKLSLYEDEQPRVSSYNLQGQTLSNFEFRDIAFAEAELNWRGERRMLRSPSVLLKHPYPHVGVSWAEDAGLLRYDDIKRDVMLGMPVNMYPAERVLAGLGVKENSAASLCTVQPPTGAPALAYQTESSWTNWPAPTEAASWPIQLGAIPLYPVTNVWPLWTLAPPLAVTNPDRVYVRLRGGIGDDMPQAGGYWGTVAKVFSYRNQLPVSLSAPTLGAESAKLRVAVNQGGNAISVGSLDRFGDVETRHFNDGRDPNMTVRGELLELYSAPRTGDPNGLQHSLHASNDGLTKRSAVLEKFMRELTVVEDSCFAVYGICMPHVMLSDSSRFHVEWVQADFDTVVVGIDAGLTDIMRTSPFHVPLDAEFEYAVHLYARHAQQFSSQFDFIVEFFDTTSEEVMLADTLNVTLLPADSAWYALRRIDISSLAHRTVYMRLALSDTSSSLVLDIADIYDVGVEAGKEVRQQAEAPSPHSPLLRQNYPNPFNPVTTIAFSIPEAGAVTLRVYDNLGREVRTLVSGDLTPGNYSVDFDAGSLLSGVYYYQLYANGRLLTRRMLLLR
jgi:hypothetical protein